MKYETYRRIKRKVGTKISLPVKRDVDVSVSMSALKSGYCCLYDKLPCKRFDYVLGDGACFTYDVHGRLRFVCKRFVAPVGFLLSKQLSSEQMKDSTDLGNFTL